MKPKETHTFGPYQTHNSRKAKQDQKKKTNLEAPNLPNLPQPLKFLVLVADIPTVTLVNSGVLYCIVEANLVPNKCLTNSGHIWLNNQVENGQEI